MRGMGMGDINRDVELGQALTDRDMLEDAVIKLEAENERLRAALGPFAKIPVYGEHGGPLVSATINFEDGSSGSDLRQSPNWPGHITKEWFERAKAAYNPLA